MFDTNQKEADRKDLSNKTGITVFADTWKLVNNEKRIRESMDDVINRVFHEWQEFKKKEGGL